MKANGFWLGLIALWGLPPAIGFVADVMKSPIGPFVASLSPVGGMLVAAVEPGSAASLVAVGVACAYAGGMSWAVAALLTVVNRKAKGEAGIPVPAPVSASGPAAEWVLARNPVLFRFAAAPLREGDWIPLAMVVCAAFGLALAGTMLFPGKPAGIIWVVALGAQLILMFPPALLVSR